MTTQENGSPTLLDHLGQAVERAKADRRQRNLESDADNPSLGPENGPNGAGMPENGSTEAAAGYPPIPVYDWHDPDRPVGKGVPYVVVNTPGYPKPSLWTGSTWQNLQLEVDDVT